MRYINEKTGAIIDSTFVIQGADWQVEQASTPASEPTSDKASEPTSDKASEPVNEKPRPKKEGKK